MPARWKASPSSLGAGEAAHRGGQVRVGAAAVEDLAEGGDAAVEPERVEARQRLPCVGPRDLEADDAPARAHDARELAQAGLEVGQVAQAEGDRRGREGAVAERHRGRVAAHPLDRRRVVAARLARGAAAASRPRSRGPVTWPLRPTRRASSSARSPVPQQASSTSRRGPTPVSRAASARQRRSRPGRHDAVHRGRTGPAMRSNMRSTSAGSRRSRTLTPPPSGAAGRARRRAGRAPCRRRSRSRRRACRAACRTRAWQAVSAHRPGAA